MTQSTALINEITDQELDLATLTEISGGGKKPRKGWQVDRKNLWKWRRRTYVWRLCRQLVKVITIIAGSAGVHQEPGSEDPGPGVLH